MTLYCRLNEVKLAGCADSNIDALVSGCAGCARATDSAQRGAAGAPSSSQDGQKRRRVAVHDKTVTWYRLMKCIWKVCIQERSRTIFRDDIMAYCDSHTDFLSRAEIDDQHRTPFTTVGQGHHFIKIDRKHGLVTLTEKYGEPFCMQEFGGRLALDDE